jgi:hypothetical protein
MNQPARDEAALSPIERSLVAALVSAIVKELRLSSCNPRGGQPCKRKMAAR